MTPIVTQLTSGHSVQDERIMHRMAETSVKYGYKSRFVVPHDGKARAVDIELVPCPKTHERVTRRERWLASWHIILREIRHPSDVCQIHDPDMLPGGLVLSLLGRKMIYDVHDDYEASFKDRFRKRKCLKRWFPSLWWWFERQAAKAFDGVIVADRHLAQKFDHCNPVILGNYPRINFTPAADADQESTFNLIYVGGVTDERGVGMALDALQRIPKLELRLHIIGAGHDENLMARLRAEPRVVLHGRVDWSKLHQYYTKAHVGLALYQPLDGFVTVDHSVKIVEYMAAGIPAVCSNFPGLKAFVEDQGCGLTVQPDDPNAIAATIKRLIENPDLRKRLGAKGRELFENEYNWEMHEHRLVELYERVLGR